MDETVLYPTDSYPVPSVFLVFYYGLCLPVAYIGNLFTFIIACKVLKYRDSVPDVLVGSLALNDFLTALVVLTPSIIADIRQQWFPNLTFCCFHAVVTDWYIYTTFGIIVLISLDRWSAITRPYFYRNVVTSLRMKFLVAISGLFCLLTASLPLMSFGVTVRAGWYCSLVEYIEGPGSNGTIGYRLPLANIGITCSYLTVGMVTTVSCNLSIICQLKKKKPEDIKMRRMDRKFAKLMAVVCILFLVTWIPSLVANITCLYGLEGCHQAEFWARRIVNIGVSVNPIVYGVMKRTYRKGYIYLLHMTVYFCSCTLIGKPTNGEEIFDLREGTRAVPCRKTENLRRSSTVDTNNSVFSLQTIPETAPCQAARKHNYVTCS